jgi:hypothetical protein
MGGNYPTKSLNQCHHPSNPNPSSNRLISMAWTWKLMQSPDESQVLSGVVGLGAAQTSKVLHFKIMSEKPGTLGTLVFFLDG